MAVTNVKMRWTPPNFRRDSLTTGPFTSTRARPHEADYTEHKDADYQPKIWMPVDRGVEGGPLSSSGGWSDADGTTRGEYTNWGDIIYSEDDADPGTMLGWLRPHATLQYAYKTRAAAVTDATLNS